MVEFLQPLTDTLTDWHDWAVSQPLTALLQSRYAKGRLECYYGLAVDLKKNPRISTALQDDRVTELGDRLLPEWHSALLCYYRPGISINPHRDHSCFAAEAVMLNLGDADFIEYPQKEKCVTHLNDGAIVRLNTKILHGVAPVQGDRYSLTFRRIKPKYLHHQPTLWE